MIWECRWRTFTFGHVSSLVGIMTASSSCVDAVERPDRRLETRLPNLHHPDQRSRLLFPCEAIGRQILGAVSLVVLAVRCSRSMAQKLQA